MNQDRVPAGVRQGGQFATSTRPEADVSLAGATFEVHLDETAKLSTSDLDPLPEWPFTDAPSVDYSWDEDDHFGVELTWGGETYGCWFSGPGWQDVDDSFDIGDGPDVSSGDRDRLRAYGRAVLRRADILAGEVTAAAHAGRGRALVQALTLGRTEAALRVPGIAVQS